MIKSIFMICFLFFANNHLFSQTERLKLDDKEFNAKIRKQTWSLENEASRSGDLFVVGFPTDTLVISYMNDIEGVKNVYSKYELKFAQNIVEIHIKSWESLMNPVDAYKKEKPQYIYCYLKNKQTLMIYFSQEKVNKLPTAGNDWMELTLVRMY